MTNNNGSGTIDIDKLLEERGKIHGDARTTHAVAYTIFKELEDCGEINDATLGMIFLICVKLARAAQHPKHEDHWTDIIGYAELIKRVECGGA